MGALISFLGGSAFRAIWGEVGAFFEKRQEHRYEVERMRLQNDLDAAQHGRMLESVRIQAEMGVKTIEVQRDADLQRMDVDAWREAVGSLGRSTGIKFLDAWNGSIRPLLATLATLSIVVEIGVAGWVLTDWDRELVGAILGLYVADRTLGKRAK